MWRALAGLLWWTIAPAALACDGVSTCEVECSAGDASACTTLADFAWANRWGIGLQADRMLSPYCQAGVVDACVVLARHRAATVGAGVDSLLLGPCAAGELSACAPLIEQGLSGSGAAERERREALAAAADAFEGDDPTVAPLLRILASGEVGDHEAELIAGCRTGGHCQGALSLLGTGRVGLEALDWPRQGVRAPSHSAQDRGVPRAGGPDGALGTEVLQEGIRALAVRCESSPTACFEGVDLALRLQEAYSCDRRVLDCIGLGRTLMDSLCDAGSPMGCRGDELVRHWRERDVVAWFEEACTADDPDVRACEALIYGLRHRDSQTAQQRLASLCETSSSAACLKTDVPTTKALPEVVLLTDALSRCSSGEAQSCVALGATLARDDAATAQAWFEALACRAGDEAACLESWRLQLGASPAVYGDAGRVTAAATAELAQRCGADSSEACLELGELTDWKHSALVAASGRFREACRADDLGACLTAAALAYRLDSVEALFEELDALEVRVTRVCRSPGDAQLEACRVWSQLERGFVVLPTGELQLESPSTQLRSLEGLTAKAAATCRSDAARCDALVALVREVRADRCWEHESCPADTETLLREACGGGNTLACELRAENNPGITSCAEGKGAACVVSGQWRAWRGLEVAAYSLSPLCEAGQAEACALIGAPDPRVRSSCASAVLCDEACRRGDGLACRELAASSDTLRAGESLALETLSRVCLEGHAGACKTWARGLDVHGGERSGELERALIDRCQEGDAASCVWTVRFQGRAGLESLEALALADCSQTNPGACAWAGAAARRLRSAGDSAEDWVAPVVEPLVGTAEDDCIRGDRRACNALGLAATGRTLPLPATWSALEGPLPSDVLEPLTELSLPAERLRREAWADLVRASKKTCRGGDLDACRDVVAGQMWTLETCTSARCSRSASKSLCGLGVTLLCEDVPQSELAAVWSATLRSGTVGDERTVADLRRRCLTQGDAESCVAASAEVVRREVVATPATPDDRATLEVACRAGATFACERP